MIVQCVIGMMIAFPVLRAIILLAIPKLMTSRMRSIAVMFVIAWAFQSSALNTTRNLQTLAESIACVRDSTITVGNRFIEEANQQSNKFSLDGVTKNARFFVEHIANFRRTLRNLQRTVLAFAKQAKDYVVQLLTVKEHCQRFFIGPFYLICSVARFSEQVCVIPERMKDSLLFGLFAYTKDKMKLAMNKALNGYNISFFVKEAKAAKSFYQEIGIVINHSTESNQSKYDDYEIMNFRADMRESMARYKIFVDVLTTAISIFIGATVLLTFISATRYAIKYNRSEKLDNVYITNDFRDVDMLREAQGQPTLLPLLPKERDKYLEGFTFRMVAKEKSKMLLTFALTIVGGFVPAILVLLDTLTYQTLYFTHEFLRSNSTRTEALDFYKLQASGEGFAASLLQRILEIFNPIAGESYGDDWRRCFAEPNPPDFVLIRWMLMLYVFALILCVLQVYASRIRRLVARHYWPDRTKPRTLWLYNKVLEGRQNILSQMVKVAKKKELEHQLADDEMAGRGHIINRGLPIITADKYSCTRCARPDLSITDASNTRICPNCNSLYCTDCYAIRKKCTECGASLQKVMKETEFYVDSSCEEDDMSTNAESGDEIDPSTAANKE